MAWFLNHYVCDECEQEWDDELSCTCDDDCPHCGARHMQVSRCIDLTEIVVQDDEKGTFLVLRSPDTAEDKPRYRVLAEFPTRDKAERFLEFTPSE